MNKTSPNSETEPELRAVDWMRVLAKYRQPHVGRSLFELAVTAGAFVGFWAMAWWMSTYSFWFAFVFCVVAAIFLVRLFIIQHDCGHGAFFPNRGANDWLGRALGIFTLTPYDVWKRTHAIHHSSSGNLEKRGFGDIYTLTVAEYKAKSKWGRMLYWAYRSPITLFFIGPIYVFGLENRLPLGYFKSGWRYWTSAMGTNLGIILFAGIMIYFMGLGKFLFVFGVISFFAAAIGIWLFYVQHQFEETQWDMPDDWDMHEAALHGSSHYVLPQPLRWLSGNIGIHHVHHLYSRIPFYRLPEVIRDQPALNDMKRLTIMKSLGCINLHLWDESQRCMVSFAEVKRRG